MKLLVSSGSSRVNVKALFGIPRATRTSGRSGPNTVLQLRSRCPISDGVHLRDYPVGPILSAFACRLRSNLRSLEAFFPLDRLARFFHSRREPVPGQAPSPTADPPDLSNHCPELLGRFDSGLVTRASVAIREYDQDSRTATTFAKEDGGHLL
jgi:hypothetical protein